MLVAAIGGCVIDTVQGSSPIDGRLAPPPSPAIDAHYDLVFGNVPCTPGASGGIAGWRVVVDGSKQDSGLVSCFDGARYAPFAVRFQDLAPSASYTLEATGYLFNPRTGLADLPCFTARCSAYTARSASAVIPSCNVVRTC